MGIIRIQIRLLTAIVLVGFAPAVAAQQPRDDVEITSVAVGFPSVGKQKTAFLGTSLFKEFFWTPVYVDVQCYRPYRMPAELVVEASDSDHMPVRYTVPLPVLQPGQNETVISYLRAGTRNDNITVSIVHAGRSICQDVMQPINGIDPSQFLFLCIGSGLDAAPLPGVTIEESSTPNVVEVERSLKSMVNRVSQLPPQWFGFDGVDTVFLSTSDRDFVIELVNERDGRKSALIEWVRRGGKLVVSIGKNQDLLAGAQELTDALPALPIGTMEPAELRLGWTNLSAGEEPLGQVTVAKLSPKAERHPETILSTLRSGSTPSIPIALRAAYGFGRVTVVAFDFDDKQLVRWKHRDTFWRELTNLGGARVPSVQLDQSINYRRFGGGQEVNFEDGEFRSLVTAMENFPGVPVISFGWVALFILAYIILVGPIDYLFLKKVVKRLELTWITFPIIVLTVSAIAYFAAYSLKGSDLRINKYDFVDIDLRSRLVQGHTWFTLFSPRIQNYNIGVDPAWVRASGDPDVIVGWSGQSQQTRTSLFRRSYDYLPRAVGLKGVPVQVWSTKGFQSSWLASTDGNKPLAVSGLFVPDGGRGLNGTITLNLPLPLEHASLLFSDGQGEPLVRQLGTLQPNEPKTITAVEPRQFKNWANDPFSRQRELDENVGAVRAGGQKLEYIPWLPIGAMFGELRMSTIERPTNASLRRLDQSWRLAKGNTSEAILIGTIARLDGAAEAINADGGNPAQLWLGAFPNTPGAQRPKLDGTLKQETCVRIILPVRNSSASGPTPP